MIFTLETVIFKKVTHLKIVVEIIKIFLAELLLLSAGGQYGLIGRRQMAG